MHYVEGTISLLLLVQKFLDLSLLKNYIEMTLNLFMHLSWERRRKKEKKKKLGMIWCVLWIFKIYISKCLVRDWSVKEAQGSLMGHFEINKTYKMWNEPWLKMKHNAHKFCSQYFKCKEIKSILHLNGL